MTKLLPLQVPCPTCRSEDVFYSCHTTCCFNHVCSSCRTTFELETVFTGKIESLVSPEGERDTSLPTVSCSQCGCVDVFEIEGTKKLVCTGCYSMLALNYKKIVPDS